MKKELARLVNAFSYDELTGLDNKIVADYLFECIRDLVEFVSDHEINSFEFARSRFFKLRDDKTIDERLKKVTENNKKQDVQKDNHLNLSESCGLGFPPPPPPLSEIKNRQEERIPTPSEIVETYYSNFHKGTDFSKFQHKLHNGKKVKRKYGPLQMFEITKVVVGETIDGEVLQVTLTKI